MRISIFMNLFWISLCILNVLIFWVTFSHMLLVFNSPMISKDEWCQILFFYSRPQKAGCECKTA